MVRFLLLAGLAGLLFAQNLALKKHQLTNGLTVIIHEDHDIPNVALYFFYKVGSRNEKPGTTGVSHFFEHMMFNGAKKYGPKQFDIVMENNGGRNNGYTSRDVTVYQDWFAKPALGLILDMEADRMRDLAFDPKLVESERGVVYSERRLSVDNTPEGALDEQLWAAAFTAHPYHWGPIGWPSDIEGWTLADLKEHFRMGYGPNNCVLVISGDVTEAQALQLSKRYLEPIPRRDGPPPVRTKEPEQQGERRVVLNRPVELPQVMIAFHVPATSHADTPAIELLTAVLAQGRSSRLEQRLVEREQLALTVQAGTNESIDPTLWTFYLQPRDGVKPEQVEQALYEELDRATKTAVSEEELRKAKSQYLANFYRQMKTLGGKAGLIGNFEIFHGDAASLNTYAARLEKVTAADLQRVARAYLSPRNRTVATLVPVKE
ncbi:MAG: insulinase family protein [Bryobacteraceae bacterium]|nr:insulinase family protein [Bryobacteraceae bacterium]